MASFLILNKLAKHYIGELDDKHYARRLVGHDEGIVVRCKKPSFSKAQRKKMSERPQVKRFVEVNKEAQAIFHDPELRAQWEAKHQAAMEKSTHYVSPRLWDFIRHELNLSKKESGK